MQPSASGLIVSGISGIDGVVPLLDEKQLLCDLVRVTLRLLSKIAQIVQIVEVY